MKWRPKGIYCLEIGEWFDSLKRKRSVEPVLQLLCESPMAVPFIHRDIATQGDLTYYLRKWVQGRHKDYPILYLAFHGTRGGIDLFQENGRRLRVSTDKLFEYLSGKCHKRVIHFGACRVLDLHGHTLNRYLRDSGAAAISGYSKDVDWVDSSVFEMFYLAQLQHNQFTRPGLRAVRNRVSKVASGLSRSLRFEMKIKS
jgi:hypothetical protein